mgnify:CR=1 FL=1
MVIIEINGDVIEGKFHDILDEFFLNFKTISLMQTKIRGKKGIA